MQKATNPPITSSNGMTKRNTENVGALTAIVDGRLI